jgi:uncharacterized damage-inducible protein DinB
MESASARVSTKGSVIGRPQEGEAAAYYFGYINQVAGEDIPSVIEAQQKEIPAFLSTISEEKSLHRYAADKWSIRQVVGHINDCERLFVMRAFWFARGFESELPSFEQEIAVQAARSDEYSWASHIEEFRAIRAATSAFFDKLPADAWTRKGVASGNPFTVRALAYMVAGHVTHHVKLLKERYL